MTHIVCDCPGSRRAHGYTVGPESNTWYWIYDGIEESVGFKDVGYPTDHPAQSGASPPDTVVSDTEQFVDERAPFIEVESKI
jgi:hypothetical protein